MNPDERDDGECDNLFHFLSVLVVQIYGFFPLFGENQALPLNFLVPLTVVVFL
jgi:hypothetical protein